MPGLEAIKDTPPWVAILVTLIPLLGGGSFGAKQIFSMQEELAQMQRTIDQYQFRINAHADRLNGVSVKNREQDRSIQNIEIRMASHGLTRSQRKNP